MLEKVRYNSSAFAVFVMISLLFRAFHQLRLAIATRANGTIRGAKISLGVDPLGGADVYRGPIGNGCSLNLTVMNPPRGSKAGVVCSSM